MGSIVKTPDGEGQVIEVNLIGGTLRVRLEKNPDSPPKLYDKKDCVYLRGGKKRKAKAPEKSEEAQEKAPDQKEEQPLP